MLVDLLYTAELGLTLVKELEETDLCPDKLLLLSVPPWF